MGKHSGGVLHGRRPAARTLGDPLAQSHIAEALGRRAARGALSTVVTQWGRFVLQTVSTIILARFLTPSDYGLVEMVAALVGVGDAIWNLGLQTATVQRREITQAQVTFFFWLQLCLGIALTLAADACAPLIVGFYHQPRLYPILFTYSCYFALSGLLAQHQAVLARQMRFTVLALIDISALVVSSVVAIAMAAAGATYWAIIVQVLVSLAVRAALYWYSSGWTPGRPRWEHGMRPMLLFGVNLALSNFLSYLGMNADNILIGKVYGATPLGNYNRAYNLLLLPLRQIQAPMGRVAIPVLSYLQLQPERYRRYYRTAASGACYLAMPLTATLAALAPEIISILLGPKWSSVAPIFRVLAIAGTIQALTSSNSWIFTSTGHTGRQAIWATVSQPILIASFVIGLPWGVLGVSWAYTITTFVLTLPGFAWAVRDTPLRIRDVWDAGFRPVTLSGLAFCCAYGMHRALAGHGSWIVALAGIGTAVLAMAIAFVTWPSVRKDILTMRRAISGTTSDPPSDATDIHSVEWAGLVATAADPPAPLPPVEF